MKKLALLLLLLGGLVSCTKHDSRTFSSKETEIRIPEVNILGSVMFLPKVSENEIGFFLGPNIPADDIIIVTLTRHEYLCRSRGSETDNKNCVASTDARPAQRGADNVVKKYTNPMKSNWGYSYSNSDEASLLASCTSIPNRPNIGRCFTEGRYKDIDYSAIFNDNRPGGVLQVQADVERQIETWDVKAK